MVLGFAAIAVAFGGYVYATNKSTWRAREFKRDHPLISVVIILAAGYLLVFMFGAVIVFMFGIAFPMLCKFFFFFFFFFLYFIFFFFFLFKFLLVLMM
jgi:hypothetical protein